jgi:hypothetical protein
VLAELRGPTAGAKLVTFYNPSGRYAGLTFLDLLPNLPYCLGSADYVVPGLMSAPLTPKQVRELLAVSSELDAALQLVSSNADLVTVDDDLLAEAEALNAVVYKALSTKEGRATKARIKVDKLCARKRSALFPIRDSRVTAKVGSRAWLTYRYVMRDPAISARLSQLRATAARKNEGIAALPLLRVLDTVLWMR